jgi:hypothetical protein
MTITMRTPTRARLLSASFLRGFALAGLVCLQGLAPACLGAQERPVAVSAVPETLQDSISGRVTISPKGAFLRAVLLPGWGHAAIGSFTRGGFYFAAEVTTGWGLLRTNRRLLEARDRVTFREDVIRAELAAIGVEDPTEVDAAFASDEVLEDLNDLVAAREDQQEDWAALGIFLLFLAGADAFVSAHLADFPTPIDLNAAPLPGGRVEFSVGLALPNR